MHTALYVFPIVEGRTVGHLAGNIEAWNVKLSTEEIEEVNSCYDFDPGFPRTFLSGTMFDGSRLRGASKSSDVMHTKLAGTFDWVEPPQSIP
jgi:hypothetical protein